MARGTGLTLNETPFFLRDLHCRTSGTWFKTLILLTAPPPPPALSSRQSPEQTCTSATVMICGGLFCNTLVAVGVAEGVAVREPETVSVQLPVAVCVAEPVRLRVPLSEYVTVSVTVTAEWGRRWSK